MGIIIKSYTFSAGATIIGGTGFTVICTALDTSTYNYYLLKR